MSKIKRDIETLPVAALLEEYPFIDSYFSSAGLEYSPREQLPLKEYLRSLEDEFREDKAIDVDETVSGARAYIEQMLEFLGLNSGTRVRSVSILPGTTKSGEPEGFEALEIRPGEIVSIVGPTGSGKSRLLADIEWMAQRDTPTGRQVLVNGTAPDKKWRFSTSDKLVAQLSQNMNFVMDLTVQEFITLHAESRLIENTEEVMEKIIARANELAGEQFSPETPITSLSGGQSRALMIADTAILSKSPIVLIDEIENAGIDRKKALELLLSEEKIVLMATHDPILALMADKRIIIKNGGIASIIETSDGERGILHEIEALDRRIQTLRGELRAGKRLDQITI
ncbi:ABC transporter ATP-binding protein [Marispirochaeta aestuarii]|uniref:ABC transporter ATP-binding protein n=1 Tax=Marispirochaeta aestuarii TaxID=1963862 RepID=UPI0029C6050C|nr:ABC transporter ATP-binding protein [Marispirochaeta aestuarii]